MSTASRRLDVLRAIVVEYVNTKEPVASKAVASFHVTGVSSATIRNDMGVLEGEGLIRQPHTSAGRVPTEAGYRLFVECLDPTLSLAGREKRLIESDLREAESVEDAIWRTVRILAGITGQAAVAEYPELGSDTVRRIEVVDLAPGRYLVLLITAAGEVHEQKMESPGEGPQWAQTREAMNAAVEGSSLHELEDRLRAGEADVPEHLQGFYRDVASAALSAVKPLESSRLATAGAANLVRAGIEAVDVARILEILEDNSTLLRLLHRDSEDRVHVAIGAEQLDESLTGVSLVSASYGGSRPTHTHVGVLGPTRMDYARSLAAVDAVSQYLSRLILKRSGPSEDDPAELSNTGEVSE